jgi:hypothetical protein
MAIRRPNSSDQIRLALLAGLSDFMDTNDPLAKILKTTRIGLHIFTLGLRDIMNGAGLQDAKAAGWRFLAGDPSGEVVAADVIQPLPGAAQNGAAKMTSLSRDPIIADAIRAVHEVEKLPEVQNKNYEIQVLRIPGLLIEAFWLKSQDAGADLIVPVLTRARELHRMRAYPVADFLNILRPMTEKFLAFEEYAN